MSSFTEAFPRPTRLAFAALVSLVVLAGCWIPKASAGTKIQLTGSSSYPLQSWVNAAKAPTPTTTVKVAFQNCDVGCSSYNAITGIGSIKIAKNASEALAEKVLYHELGHVFADRRKGVRAVTHAAFTVGLLAHCLQQETPHSGFVLLDTPLSPFKGMTDAEEDPEMERSVREACLRSLATRADLGQTIMIENVDPPVGLSNQAVVHEFVGELGDGREGFYPPSAQ